MIEVYLEKAPRGCMAHLFSHLGCVALARRLPDLQEAVNQALALYADIGHRRGFSVAPVHRPLRIHIVQQVLAKPVWESGNPASLFAPDFDPLTPQAVQHGFHIMNGLRKELLSRVRPLERKTLYDKPDPKRRSIRETLEHLADCQWWYLSRIDDQLPEDDGECPHELFSRMTWLLNNARQHLLELPGNRQAMVTVPQRYPTADPSERWTPRKVLRRLLEHEFEHLSVIDRDIAAAEMARRQAET